MLRPIESASPFQISLADGCLSGWQIGQGSPVIFIQGVGVHGGAWAPQIRACQEQFRCIWFDNRGIGASHTSKPLESVDQLADDTINIADHLNQPYYHLVGHSLGGLIAIAAALRAPERVLSLTLMCTFADGSTVAPLSWRMMWVGMRTQVGSVAQRRLAFLELLYAPAMLASSYPNRPARLAHADALSTLFGHDLGVQPRIVPQQLRIMRRSNYLNSMNRLASIPALILIGHHDLIAPPTVGQALAASLPGSKTIEVPDAAHGLPLTHVDLTNRHLLEHLTLHAKM